MHKVKSKTDSTQVQIDSIKIQSVTATRQVQTGQQFEFKKWEQSEAITGIKYSSVQSRTLCNVKHAGEQA